MMYALGILLLLVAAKKKNSGSPPKDISGFGPALYKWLARKEGRLATSSVDSELEKAPCVIYQDGKPKDHPHTSRGVTWETFVTLSDVLGYEANCNNFASLSANPPGPIWHKIVDYIRQKGYTYSSNPVIATYIGLWYWGGWDQTEQMQLTPVSVMQVLNSNIPDRAKLIKLINMRKNYFHQVVKKRPSKKPALEGWLERADEYWTEFSPYV